MVKWQKITLRKKVKSLIAGTLLCATYCLWIDLYTIGCEQSLFLKELERKITVKSKLHYRPVQSAGFSIRKNYENIMSVSSNFWT